MRHKPSPAPNRPRWAAALVWLASWAACAAPATPAYPSRTAEAAECRAQSGPRQALLVELYTSEGCNSCPPADRWLSTLRGRPELLAAAFHVDYWDRLGWVDRFASPRHTQRQADSLRHNAARFSYTPQLLVNGRDWRAGPDLPSARAAARVRLDLQRDDAGALLATVTPLAGAPPQLALWWARIEDGHVSQVRAGENRGVTLHHDAVVSQYREQPAWPADAARRWRIAAPLAAAADTDHAPRWLVVVTDAATGAPLQALELGC